MAPHSADLKAEDGGRYLPRLLGGRLCLDFANTVEEGRHSPHPFDCIPTYRDLVRWARHTALVDDARAAALQRMGGQNAAAAGRVHRRALTLREAIYRVFSAAASGAEPSATDLAVVAREAARATAHGQLAPDGEQYQWWWEIDAALDGPLWPVAHSAVALLTSPERPRVKECANCGWLFLDKTKNGSRRWCSMESCGSRMKMRRQYARRRGREAHAGSETI